jgi:3-dehydroquinate synthase
MLVKTLENSAQDNPSQEFPSDCYQQKFHVHYEYPVYFTRDLFNEDNDLLASTIDGKNEARCHRLKIFIDSGVIEAIPEIQDRITKYVSARPDCLKIAGKIEIVPGGERSKNSWDLARRIMGEIAKERLDRQSFVVAVGGGSVLDIVGFAASLVHRGLRLIRIPTTVLAQNDAGIGVKNGIDEQGMKNFAGTFSPPFAVLVDYHFLQTLAPKYWTGGIAEAFKVAIIKDKDFFGFLCANAQDLKNRDDRAIEYVVKRCAELHLDHIRTSGDPFEFGSARPLDFGHWSAHKLEILSDYELGHGQAVSIGIAIDSVYASMTGLLNDSDCMAILDALEKTGLPVWHDILEMRNKEGKLHLIKGIDEFQEHLGGRLCITLPDGIGKKIEVHEMDPVLLEKAVSILSLRKKE